MSENNEKLVDSYMNKFGQTIAIGDKVHYPTWCADVHHGVVKKIWELDGTEWNRKLKKHVPVKLHRLQITRPSERWVYKVGSDSYSKPFIATINIWHGWRVMKLYTDEVL